MSNNERDINEIFDDIALAETSITNTAYDEGFQQAITEGNLEGYKLGYTKGVELGEELGNYYGTIIAHMQLTNSEKVQKILQNLKISIEKFPRTNDPNIDIITEIQNIRTQYKRIKILLKLPTKSPSSSTTSTGIESTKDLSF